MNILWKGIAAVTLAVASLGAATVPAQAQYYGDRDGWRGDRDGRDWRRDNRRWDNRRHWRGHDRRYWNRGYARPHRYVYRQRCWTELQYRPYYDRTVRVRVCR